MQEIAYLYLLKRETLYISSLSSRYVAPLQVTFFPGAHLAISSHQSFWLIFWTLTQTSLPPPPPITCNLFPVPSKNIPPHTHFQSSLILSIAQRGARSSSPPAPLASYHTSSTPSSFSSSAIATGPSNLKTHHFSSFQFRHMYLATPPPCLHFSLLPYHPPTLSYLSLPCFNFLILVSLHYITIKTHPSYPKIHQEHVR